jgi:hypothetical protein
MIDPWNSISMLAADDGVDTIVQFALFIIIGVGSIIGAVMKKNAEKRQQEQARQKAQEAKEILARRAQREQAQQRQRPQKESTFGAGDRKTSPRDFIRSRDAATPPPTPKPSMFAAPPRPVNVEAYGEHHLVDLTPIEHLPPEEQLIHADLPSSGHGRKTAVNKLIRKRSHATPKPVETSVSELHELPELSESHIHTRVNLMDPATARAAIIFQEILSPPLALRQGREMWD